MARSVSRKSKNTAFVKLISYLNDRDLHIRVDD